jgi:hypothetical protein
VLTNAALSAAFGMSIRTTQHGGYYNAAVD